MIFFAVENSYPCINIILLLPLDNHRPLRKLMHISYQAGRNEMLHGIAAG